MSSGVKKSGSALGPGSACTSHSSSPPVPQEEEEVRNVFRSEVVRLGVGTWQRLHLPDFFPT